MLAILQVAIGLIFVFSLLSILVTTVNTIVTNLMKTRTRFLRREINNLITDPEMQAQFVSHPLINLVKAPMIPPGYTANAQEASAVAAQLERADVTKVTWIDPKIFAQVLSSLLTEKAELTLYGPLLMTADALPEGAQKERLIDLVFGLQSTGIGMSDIRAAVYELPADYQPHLFAALEPIEARLQELQGDNDDASRLLPLLEGVRRVNNETFRRALKVIVGSARSLTEAQAQFETWFNARMDQLSDVYKRRMLQYSIVIGTVLVLLLNVDTLNMANTLWTDPAVRAAVEAAATEAINSGALQNTTTGSQQELTDAQNEAIDPNLDAVADFQEVLDDLLELNLPIGWGFVAVEGGCFRPEGESLPLACSSPLNLWNFIPGNSPLWGGLILKKLIGIAVTVIAIGQGAPFWFDLLNRLVRGK